MNNFSVHYQTERSERERFINEFIGLGEEQYAFEYPYNGTTQIHKITTTGIVNVYDRTGERLITRLVARPQQIRRYFEANGRRAPASLVDLARKHAYQGYNEI